MDSIIKFDSPERDALRDLSANILNGYKPVAEKQADSENIGAMFDDVGKPGPDRFRVLRYEDLKNQPPMRWLIKGVLPQAELAVLFGEPGSGKSFLAFDMACAIERGQPWGHSELRVNQGRTFYVFAEGGAGARGRFEAYVRKHGDGPLPGAIIDVPNLLNNVDGQAIVDRVDNEGGADLIVIDTLSASMSGGDENGGKDMGRAIHTCKLIHKKTGALVVLIHHSGKDSSKGARGWSGLKAATDAELEVTRNGDYRNATVSKMKDGRDGAQFSFKLETVAVGVDEDGDEITSCVLSHIESRRMKAEGPTGMYIDPIRKVLRELDWIDGHEIPLQTVIDHAKKNLPAPEKGAKDYRAGNLRRLGVLKLEQAGELEFAQGGNAVRKCGAICNGDWLDE